QPLPSPGRTPVEIRARRGGAVILADELLRGLSRDVDGAERVIEQLLPVDGERPELFDGGVVTGVGLGDGEAGLERRVASGAAPLRRKRFSRISAVPEHVKPVVPGRGHATLEAYFRQNLSCHVAILRQVAGCRNQRGRLD